MEPGEDITEAAKREVLEETGLTFEVTTMFAVECAGQCITSGICIESGSKTN